MPGSLRGCLLTHASDDSRAAGAGRQDSQHWWLHALRNPATRGGELPFLPFIGQFHSVLSKDMEELCHLGLIAFFPPGVIIIWYVLRSYTLLYLNLLNITAATYWATMRCITCARCFQPCLNSLQSMHHYLHLRSKTQESQFIQRHGKL